MHVDTERFLKGISHARLKRTVDSEKGATERFSMLAGQQVKTQDERLRGLVTAVIQHVHPVIRNHHALSKGLVVKVDMPEETIDFTRVWVGHLNYVLFWFIDSHPGSGYPIHRFLTARCLSKESLDENQLLVQAVEYDLSCVRANFPINIWDQNFLRQAPIKRGRIRGTGMQMDPLYNEFSNIGTYIGVEIPIVGKNQLVKVLRDGRIQFMAWQAEQLEDLDTRDSVLDSIVQVLDKLKPCET
jgi:hypothetical protein